MTIGLIRVISGGNEDFLESHARAIQTVADLDIISRAIDDQPDGIHDAETFEAAVPKIIELGGAFAADGVDKIIISCAADPGLPELRHLLDIPVIGAGSAGAALARALGGGVGVLGITAGVPVGITAILGNSLVADIVPDGVSRTTDLMTEHGRGAARAAADQLVQLGAGSILFACTGLTTVNLAAEIAADSGVPVIDAVLAAGLAAGYPHVPTLSPIS